MNTVALLSLGGSVSESLKIGALIRERMLKTQAPVRLDQMPQSLYIAAEMSCTGGQCYCASACFFIWAAGIRRIGDALLVHRPHDASGSFGRKQATTASSEYNVMLGQVSNYLVQIDVPPAIVAYVKSVSSNKASHIPQDQVSMYLGDYVPSIHKWLIADCGATNQREEDDWKRLMVKTWRNDIQPSEKAYFDLLDEKRRYIFRCERVKLSNERKRLAEEDPL